MKHIYLFSMALLACTASFAQSVLTLTSNNGAWNTETDWSPKRLPTHGDIIVIPANKTLNVDRSITANDIHLKVYGKVTLTDKATILDLNGNSSVYVYDGGKVEGTEANQQLRIGHNIVYLGNEPPVLGPAYATTTTADFMPITITTLPVKFLGFSLTRQNSDVLVQWSTTEELTAHSFEVERSTDGSTWNRIATEPAKGSLSTTAHYSLTDRQVTAPMAHYRIRQVDADGKYTYTSVKTIRYTNNAQDVAIAAINNRVVLQFPVQVKGAVEVRLVSLSGQVVNRQVIHQPVGQVVLNPAQVKGAYIVAVSNATGLSEAKQVIL